MAYQKRNKGPRYASTGAIINPGNPGLRTHVDLYKRYLAGLMKDLQNKARQTIYRKRPFLGKCLICGEMDTSWFYLSYDKEPQVIALCQTHHKEYSQMRGSVYDQLVRHGIPVLSWEDWKSGMRPQTTK